MNYTSQSINLNILECKSCLAIGYMSDGEWVLI